MTALGLIRLSWQVLRGDKRLLLLALASQAFRLYEYVSLWIDEDSTHEALANVTELHGTALSIAEAALLLGLTLPAYWLTGLLCIGVMHRLVEERFGWRQLFSWVRMRLPLLLIWACIAFLVSYLSSAATEIAETPAQLVPFLLVALAWTVGTFAIVPILIVEREPLWPSLRRSVALLRYVWLDLLLGTLAVFFAAGVATLAFVIVVSRLLGEDATVLPLGIMAMNLVANALVAVFWIVVYAVAVEREPEAAATE